MHAHSFNPMLKSQFLCFGVQGQTLSHLPKKVDFQNQTQKPSFFSIIVTTITRYKRHNIFKQNVQIPVQFPYNTFKYIHTYKKKKKQREEERETLEALSLTLLHRDAALSGKLKNEMVLWFSLAKSITCHLQNFQPHFSQKSTHNNNNITNKKK